MKKFVITLVFLVMAGRAYAMPMIEKGAREMSLDFNYSDGDIALEAGYGMFFTDNILVKGLAGYNYIDAVDSTRWQAGCAAEYHWYQYPYTLSRTVPYFSLILAYSDWDGDSIVLYGPALGVNHFLTNYLALDLNLKYIMGSESWYEDEEVLQINAGLRVRF